MLQIASVAASIALSPKRRALRPSTGLAAALFMAAIHLTPVAARAQLGTVRYSATVHGDIRIAGNTLGLSKASGTNAPGTLGSIGTFLSTDAGLVDAVPAPGWPAGPPSTTSAWASNSSAGPLRIPVGSTVLHAELVWGGSYQYGTEDVSSALGSAVTLAFSDGASISVNPDPATGATISTIGCGSFQVRYYSRSADVTSFVASKGAGTYTAKGVPGTQIESINSLNAAGWCLIVAYANAAEPLRFVAMRVGGEYIDECATGDHPFTGFTIPSSGDVGVRVVLAAMEGDASGVGDQAFISDAGNTLHALSTPNNPVNNFFASQINDSNGALETSGTAGSLNHNASAGTNVSGGRQGWDITGVQLSAAGGQVNYGQTSLSVRLQTTGDEFVVVGVGVAVDTDPPTGDVLPGALASELRLEPPSPNPLVSSTRIRYSIGRSRDLRVSVVDAAGRWVTTLRSGAWAGGAGSCEWDGRDAAGHSVSAGLYFVALDADGRRAAQRMTVVR